MTPSRNRPARSAIGAATGPRGGTTRPARELIKAAHKREMLVQLFYHPDPVRGSSGTNKEELRDALLEILPVSSEGVSESASPRLACRSRRRWHRVVGRREERRNGQPDLAVQPRLLSIQHTLLPATGPYFHGSWMCAFGRTGGINACGFGDRWRMFSIPRSIFLIRRTAAARSQACASGAVGRITAVARRPIGWFARRTTSHAIDSIWTAASGGWGNRRPR